MLRHSFKLAIVVLLAVGCTVQPENVTQDQVTKLAISIHSLDRTSPKKESIRLSRDIWQQTAHLTKAFDLTSPPLWHNTLVNLGMREKGLCYHWSDALYVHLSQKEYAHFSFHLVGSDIGSYLFEHNALVIVKKGETMENGIVIDPWRNSGKLYFSKVNEDEAYSWSHRPARGCETIQ